MGLDMYLYKRTYVDNNDVEVLDTDTQERKTYNKVSYIIQEAMYWRKANAIHQWFVKNIQDGKDDCGSYYCSVDSLEELLNVCKKALKYKDEMLSLLEKIRANDENALTNDEEERLKSIKQSLEEILPTKSGFFFGSTNYDEWYFQDLEYTVKNLEEIIKDYKSNDGWSSFEYHSSW